MVRTAQRRDLMRPFAMQRVIGWLRSNPLSIALGLGLALRLIRLQSRDIWYDDAFSIFLAQRSPAEIVSGTAADTMPPLYYFLLHAWMQIGQQVWFLRLLSVLLSLGIIAVFYLLTAEWVGRKAAAWAAVLAALSPLQIYHAQELRMYTLLVLGQAGYAWCFTRIWFDRVPRAGRWLNWAGLIAFGLIAMYSHNMAVFGLAVPALYLIYKRSWRLLARLALALAVIGLGALPWLFYLPGQIEKIQTAFWTPRPGLVEILQALIQFHAAMPLPSRLLIAAAVISVLCVTIMILELRRAAKPGVDLTFLAFLLFAPPVMLFIVSYLMRPVFVPRGFMISLLAYLALAGYGIAASWQRGPGKLLAGLFVLAAGLSLPGYYAFQSFPRSPYRQAVQWMEQENLEDAVIVHETKLSYFPMHFLDGALPQVFLPDLPGSSNDTFALASQQAMQIYPKPDLSTAVGSSQKVYFVTYAQIFEEYEALGAGEHPHLAWLTDRYQPVGHFAFNDLDIFTFQR